MPFLSELKYRGNAANDFAEVAVPTGMDVSNLQVVVYNPNGSVRSTNNLGALDNTIGNKDIYVVNTGIHKNGAVALVDNGTVLQFVSFDSVLSPTVGPAAGMTSTQIGSTGTNSNASLVSHDGGASYSVQTPPDAGTIPCFTADTLIATARGQVPVQDIGPDDMVLTLDNGFQPVVWAGSTTVNLRESGAHVKRPVEILSPDDTNNRLSTPLIVSPNHRILLRSALGLLMFGHAEMLVQAKDLVETGRARFVEGLDSVTYHHLALERHEVIFASDVPAETLLRGVDLLDVVAPGMKDRLKPAEPPQERICVRPVLKPFEVAALLAA